MKEVDPRGFDSVQDYLERLGWRFSEAAQRYEKDQAHISLAEFLRHSTPGEMAAWLGRRTEEEQGHG